MNEMNERVALSDKNAVEAVPYRNNDKDNAVSRLNSIVSALKEDRLISLIVEPTSHCDLACAYCGMHSSEYDLEDSNNGKVARKKKAHMKLRDFSMLVEKIAGLKPLNVLYFSGHGEPLLNNDLPEMISLAKKAKIASQIVVLTNGTLLTSEKLSTLVASGVDEIRFGLDAISPEAYLPMKGVDKSAIVKRNLGACLSEIRSENLSVRLMIECIRLKRPIITGALSEEELILKEFGKTISDTPGVVLRWRDEIDWVGQMGHGHSTSRKLPCEYPFYVLLLHADGGVSSCCADTSKQFLIADIKNINHFGEVLQSERLRELRRSLLRLDFDRLSLCRRCDFHSVVDEELFANRDMLLELLN